MKSGSSGFLRYELCVMAKFFNCGFITSAADFRRKGLLPANYRFRSALFGFVTKHSCDRRTDGRTDGQANRITTTDTALA